MDVQIKLVDSANLLTAMNLIEECFDKFVAPDYCQEGIDTFKNSYIYNKEFHEKFYQGSEKMYGAYLQDKLVGCLSISVNNTISCVFVKGEFHRQGIATRLFNTVLGELKSRGETHIKLNASPYALSFYHSIGFEDKGTESEYKGIRYTPMQYTID